jgi:aspartate/glutamate racemase
MLSGRAEGNLVNALVVAGDKLVSDFPHGATAAQREKFSRAGATLTSQQGCEAIMLARTDLALVFKEGDRPGFETLDCAALHARAIASAAASR